MQINKFSQRRNQKLSLRSCEFAVKFARHLFIDGGRLIERAVTERSATLAIGRDRHAPGVRLAAPPKKAHALNSGIGRFRSAPVPGVFGVARFAQVFPAIIGS